MCNKISCLLSNVFYLVEKFVVMAACVGLLTCLVVTLIMMLMLGIGLGYNYCYVDYQSRARYRYIPAHYYTKRPVRPPWLDGNIRSGPEVSGGTDLTPPTPLREYSTNQGSTSSLEQDDGDEKDVTTTEGIYFSPQPLLDYRRMTPTSKYVNIYKFWAQKNSTTTTNTIEHKLLEKIINKTIDSVKEDKNRTKENNTNPDIDLRSFLSIIIDNTQATIKKSTEAITLATLAQNLTYPGTTQSEGMKLPLFYQAIADVTDGSSSARTTSTAYSTYFTSIYSNIITPKTPSTKITYKRENTTDNAKESSIKYYKFWAIPDTMAATEPTRATRTAPKAVNTKTDNAVDNKTNKETLKSDLPVEPTRTTVGTPSKMISINGLDLMALLSQLRAENRNYSLQILTS